ncbi:cytochrome c oxidase subunit 7A2, mitochondrial-like [Aulostomus maculatus]
MSRHVFALQRVARRALSCSARRQLENQVPKNQKLFQEDNGLPIHLKGDTIEGKLFNISSLLTVMGGGYVLYHVMVGFPQKKV